jgi:putative addiction module component (TIGR02574 family)
VFHSPTGRNGKLQLAQQEYAMTTLVDELSQKALELPPEERVRLAERLLATVHEVDAEVEAAWDQEIQRRLAEIDNGTAKLIPAEEVFAEVRRILK